VPLAAPADGMTASSHCPPGGGGSTGSTGYWPSLDPVRFHLAGQFAGLGFVIRLDALKNISPLIARYSHVWDVTVFEYVNSHQLVDCMYPEFPRSFHMTWAEGRKAELLRFPLHLGRSPSYPDPAAMTNEGYTRSVKEYIQSNCHDVKNKIRLYENIRSVSDGSNWNAVHNAYPSLVGMGIGSQMRLAWNGILWVHPATTEQNRVLVIAKYSPFYDYYEQACSTTKVEKVAPVPVQQVWPYPMPLSIRELPAGNGDTRACWNLGSSWTVAFSSTESPPDLAPTITARLGSLVKGIARVLAV
jgi:hypothetical protein